MTEVNSKMAQGQCKKTNSMFDHFGPNIAAKLFLEKPQNRPSCTNPIQSATISV